MRGSMNNYNNPSEIVEALREKYIKVWENTPDTFPKWQETFSGMQQKENDIQMSTFADKMILLVKGFTNGQTEDPARWGTALKKLIYECGTGIIGLDGSSMRLLLEEGFCESTSDFIQKAREFDPGLKMDGISQALRNVWIMNCIQKLADCRIEVTPSVLSYSLLYPYTDNYLDANSVPSGRKRLLNQRFARRLAGECLKAQTAYEDKLFRLVENIEAQFDRSEFPMVYMSLLGIQAAQCKSLLQQERNRAGTHQDILGISFEKGGSSVLADACLVNGSLTSEETSFMFGFGVLLQLLDDLQDAAADRSCGHATIFSRQDKGQSQEIHTNRLINFTMRILDEDTCFLTPGAITVKEMMKRSLMFLLLGAAASNPKMFGRSYLNQLETYSPLSFNYLKGFYKKIGREYGKLKIKFAVNPLEAPMAKAFAAGVI
jgi:hypothetical protein